MIIFISFTTNIFAQKRVKSRDETFKGSIDINSIPTVTIAELEEHAAKLALLKQGYDESKIEVCRGRRKHFRINHKGKINRHRHRSS